MAQLFINNAASTLASGITDVATSLTVATGKGALFPAPTGGDYFLLTLTQATSETSWEVVKVTARTGDVMTIVRAQESTTAAAWATGDKAELRVTAETLNSLADDATVTAHTSNVSNPHTVTATQVGLGNVDNTSDADKPVSSAQAIALGLKANVADAYVHPANHAPSIITQDANNRFVTDAEKTAWNAKQPAGTYATGTGTANGTNTGDQTLPTLSSLGGQAALVSGTSIKTINSTTLLGSGDIAVVSATGGTASGITLNDGYTEEVFDVTGTTPALSPANGSIQTWTLTGNSTPTAGTWAAGQSITLMIDDGTAYTITWTSLAVTWKTDSGVAPALNTTGLTAIALWKVGATIYGARVGDA